MLLPLVFNILCFNFKLQVNKTIKKKTKVYSWTKKSSHTIPNNYDYFRACSLWKKLYLLKKIEQYTYVIISV